MNEPLNWINQLRQIHNISKMTNELNIPKEKDLKVIPKDKTLDGVVLALEVKTWNELTKDDDKRKKLKNPDGKVLRVLYEVSGFKRNESFPFTDNPTTSSRYGRYIVKYGDYTIGQVIKVQFDGEGDSLIILAK